VGALNDNATIRARDSPGQPPEPTVPRRIAVLAAIALLAALAWWTMPAPPPAAGLNAPMPAWAILPAGDRRVVAAGVYPPQPPYGAAATITYILEETAEQFAAAYGARLTAAGYAVRRIPPRFNIAFDEPDLQFEAAEQTSVPGGGRVIYVSLRHSRTTRFAQLTFWEPPAPRLP
jgi:hypothetical protein